MDKEFYLQLDEELKNKQERLAKQIVDITLLRESIRKIAGLDNNQEIGIINVLDSQARRIQ